MVLSKHSNFELIQKTLKSSSLNRSDDENLPPTISANMETRSVLYTRVRQMIKCCHITSKTIYFGLLRPSFMGFIVTLKRVTMNPIKLVH